MSVRYSYCGQLLSGSQGALPLNDRGLCLGQGFFTTLRAHQEHLAFFEAHYARLASSAELLQFPLPFQASDLQQHCLTILKSLYTTTAQDAIIRITVTAGPGERGLAQPTLMSPQWFVQATLTEPLAIDMRSIRLGLSHSRIAKPYPHFKQLDYLPNIALTNEAKARGVDDVLQRNNAGFITGTSKANVLLGLEDSWVTPAVDDGCLPGVVRGWLLNVNSDMAVVAHSQIPVSTFALAKALIVSNSVTGPIWCEAIDNIQYNHAIHYQWAQQRYSEFRNINLGLIQSSDTKS